jgi:hypothetical protein
VVVKPKSDKLSARTDFSADDAAKCKTNALYRER